MAQSIQSAMLLLEALSAERDALLAKHSQLCQLTDAEHGAELKKDQVLAILHASDTYAHASDGEGDLGERLQATLSDLSRLHDQVQPMAAALSGNARPMATALAGARTARRPSA
jgi:hypothetical protein